MIVINNSGLGLICYKMIRHMSGVGSPVGNKLNLDDLEDDGEEIDSDDEDIPDLVY